MNRRFLPVVTALAAICIVISLSSSSVSAAWIRRGEDNLFTQISAIDCRGFTVESADLTTIYPGGRTEDEARQRALELELDEYYDVTLSVKFVIVPADMFEPDDRLMTGEFPNETLAGRLVYTSPAFYLEFVDPAVRIAGWDRGGTTQPSYSFTYGRSRILWPASLQIGEGEELALMMAYYDSGYTTAIISEIPKCGTTDNASEAYQPPWIPDARINIDAGAPVAIYCLPNGIAVYFVNTAGRGNLSVFVSFAQIALVGVPQVNTLLGSGPSAYGGTTRLYRLNTGEFQVNSPKADGEYVYIWGGCAGVNVSNASAPNTSSAAVISSGGTYIVQRGDTLFSIARRFGVSVNTLANLNNIADPARIHVGQVLQLP